MSKQGKKQTKKHHVFSLSDHKNQDLKPVKSFRIGFNNLLKACSLNDSDSELPLSPYSLRHSFATIRIEEGTGTDLLGNHMGTGTSMIARHYSHVKTREQRNELIQRRDKSQNTSSVQSDVAEKIDAVIAALSKGKSETPDQLVRQQILDEWKADNDGQAPIPGSQFHEILFESFVQDRLKKLGYLE